jgi:PAS domain S-box-containing protein
MSERGTSQKAKRDAQLGELRRRLAEAEQTIQALTARQVDAVIVPDTATQTLLRQAQEALRRTQADLDRRVGERTTELTGTNEALQSEIGRRAAAEELLQKERDFANAVLDTAGALVVVLDREGRIARFNRACERLTGYGFGEVAGRPFWDFLLLPEEADSVRAGFDALLGGEFPNTFENYWLDRGGGQHLIAWANTALVDTQGSVEHLVATGIDVTAAREAEVQLKTSMEELQVADEELRQQNEELLAARQALEEERQRYRELFDFAPDGYLVTDLSGTVQEANRAAARLLGVETQFLAGKPLRTYVARGDRAAFHERMETLRENGSGGVLRWEMRMQPRGGEPYPAEVGVAPARDTEGQVAGLRWLLRDVSERKQAEVERERLLAQIVQQRRQAEAARAEAEQASELLRTVLEAMPVGVAVADGHGAMQFTNAASHEILGSAVEGTISRPRRIFTVHRLDGSPFPPAELPLHRAMEDGRPVADVEMLIRHADEERIILCAATPVHDAAGQITGGVAVYQDTTGRRRAEEEIRSLARFPSENPNPILRLDREGTLLYANGASRSLVPTGEDNVGKLTPQPWRGLAGEALAQQSTRTMDVESGGRVHSVVVVPIVEAGYVNFYGRDVTEQRQAEQALREARDQLELRIEERTAELKESNRALEREVAERRRAEAAAVAERQRFNGVLETLPAYVVLLTPDYHASFANRVFRERFGEAHGQRCYEFLFHRTTPCELCETYRVLDTGAPHHWEWAGPDGRDYDAYDFPFTDTDGSTLILEMGIDITERKRAEQALKELNETLEQRVIERTAELRETRDYLDNLLTHANAPIIVWDPEFRITRFNGAFERLTGLPADHAIGKPLDILFPEDRKEEAMGHIRRTVTGERWEVVEIPIQHVDGTVRTVLWNSATLYTADGTTPLATIAQGQDITQTKLAEAEREQRAVHLTALVQISQRVLAETTMPGLLQSVVDAACELVGAHICIAGHGYQQGVFEVGATSRTEGVPPCPSGEEFKIEQGGVYMQLIEKRVPLRLTAEELHQHPDWWGLPTGHIPLRGLLGVPLFGLEDQPIGLIMAAGKQQGDFTAEDEALLAQLATVSSLGLRHIQARTDAERRAEEMNTFLEALTDGVIVYDANSVVTWANPAAIELLGVDPRGEDRLNIVSRLSIRRRDGRLITTDELPSSRGLRGETMRNEQFLFTNAGGREIILLASVSPLVFGGEVVGAVAVWTDVTEHERLMGEVQQRAAELDATFAAIADGVVVYGPQGEILNINESAQELLGYADADRASTIPDRVAGLHVHTADGTPLASADAWPPMMALHGQTVRSVAMYWQRSPEDTPVAALISAAPIRGPRGESLGAVATYTDVGDLRAIQRQLEQANHDLVHQSERLSAQNRELERVTAELEMQKDRLDTVIENAPVGIVVADEQCRVLLTNPTADLLYGRSVPYSQDYESRAAMQLCYPDGTPYAPADLPLTRSALTGTSHENVETAVVWPDGQRRTLLVNTAPIRDRQDRITGAVGVFQDITQRKQIEEILERRNRNLRLLNRLSQDLGAPHEQAELLRKVLQAVHGVVASEGSVIWLWAEGRPGELACRAAIYRGVEQCPPQGTIRPGEGLAGWVAQHREGVLLSNARKDPRFVPGVDGPGGPLSAGSVLAMPLQVHDELLGVLEVTGEQANAFDAEDLMLVETLAAASAIAIENIHLHEQARQAAVLGERSRLARELHDAVSQTLFSASVIAESLPRLWERKPERVRQGLEQLQQLTHGALSEMRTLLLELRPTALAEGKMGDLLQQLVDAFVSRSRVQVDLAVETQRSLPEQPKITLYRITQEALHNVSKHARATQVEVSLRDRGDQVELRVKDDGCGFDPHHVAPDRLGLGILRERAESIDATLQIASQPGHGTEIRVLWPGETGEDANV